MFESWYHDFVLGLRALRKSPVFCFDGSSDIGPGNRRQHRDFHTTIRTRLAKPAGARRFTTDESWYRERRLFERGSRHVHSLSNAGAIAARAEIVCRYLGLEFLHGPDAG